MKYKYLIVFTIPEPYNKRICELMNLIEFYTHTPAPHRKFVPHISFHHPITDIDEHIVKNIAKSMSLKMKQTSITVSNLYHFGKEYIVLPVHATLALATLWIGINEFFLLVPRYKPGEFDNENTLHITVAEKTSSIFDKVWPILKEFSIEEMKIPVEKIEVHRKPVDGGKWERIDQYYLQK